MTASSNQSWFDFDALLQGLKDKGRSGMDKYGRFADAFNQRITSPTGIPYQPLPSGMASQTGVGAANLARTFSNVNPLLGGLLTGVGSAMSGDNLAQVGGSTVGGITGAIGSNIFNTALLTKMPFIPVPAKLAGVALSSLLLPTAGANLGKQALGGVANSLGNMAGKAADTVTQVATQGLNPNSLPNKADTSVRDMLSTYEKIRSTMGKDVADAFFRQNAGIDKLIEADRQRAATAVTVAPVATANKLALGAQNITGDLYGRAIDGVNNMGLAVFQNNPYADMLRA